MNRKILNNKLKSKKWIVFILLFTIHCSLFTSPARAQIGTWRNYLAYSDVQQIQEAGNELFVLASGSLYQYNKQDKSIHTFDKTNGMNDIDITHIKWCQQAKRLVVVYNNSNIDLVETNGDITNISDIYTKSITGGKNIYSITINGQYAYLACEYGISKLNVKNAEISESYLLGFPINAIAFDNTNIYANSPTKGVWTAPLSSNLIDPANWTPSSITPDFSEDLTDYNNNIELVETLQPGGPKYNHFYESVIFNGKLYTTGGGFLSGYWEHSLPGIVQVYDGNKWTIYQEDISKITGIYYDDNNCIDVDPNDENHVFVGGRCGLYEFQNGLLKKFHYRENSPLRTAIDRGVELPDFYTLVNTIKFDKDGNLWVLNSQANNVNLLLYTKDKQWKTLTKSELFDYNTVTYTGLRSAIIDSRGLLWFINTNWEDRVVCCYDSNTDKIYKYTSIINQDGTSYNNNNTIYTLTEDKSGNIWIGTTFGPFYIKSSEVGQDIVTFYQEKVPRNDGTDYADYLLNGIEINSIAVDEAGRKWIGTNGNGVFLISEDNMTQLHHFTSQNSKLLSDIIVSISINENTGEVFFLTNKGLCSYISDATKPNTEMTEDNVYAYPNPVNPDYTGPITITGLTFNADVKIVSANGLLINEGRSNGGSFTWDGCDKKGNRVASGIYMVVTTTSNGQKGTVCKIAIIR